VRNDYIPVIFEAAVQPVAMVGIAGATHAHRPHGDPARTDVEAKD
jgi:hypothetical protein